MEIPITPPPDNYDWRKEAGKLKTKLGWLILKRLLAHLTIRILAHLTKGI